MAQETPALMRAKALDKEIAQAKDLSDDVRPQAIQDLARRVRMQPEAYLVALAFNLGVSASEADGPETLQAVAETLADALRRSPVEKKYDYAYLMLAQLIRYGHAQVSLDDPRFTAAMAQLEGDDKRRSEADFSLRDLDGREWNLKALRGKVVLVNFGETSCPPCRAEIPDLENLYSRFRENGLVILALTSEEESVVRQFVSQQRVSYPVLLDPKGKVKELFRVTGFPVTFVYDRDGRLTGETFDRPNTTGWLELLGRAGLR